MCNVLDKVENRGRAKGREEVIALVQYLIERGRQDDLEKALVDKAFRDRLIDELFYDV